MVHYLTTLSFITGLVSSLTLKNVANAIVLNAIYAGVYYAIGQIMLTEFNNDSLSKLTPFWYEFFLASLFGWAIGRVLVTISKS